MDEKHDRSKPFQVDAENFDLEVLQSEQPVLVGFVTQWSHPCQILVSVLDEIASSCAGELKVAVVNADENPDLALWYDIRSVPTLLYFMAGNVRGKIVGTATQGAILSKLEAISTTDAVPRRSDNA